MGLGGGFGAALTLVAFRGVLGINPKISSFSEKTKVQLSQPLSGMLSLLYRHEPKKKRKYTPKISSFYPCCELLLVRAGDA